MTAFKRYCIPLFFQDLAYIHQDLPKLFEILFIILYIMFILDLLLVIRSCILTDLVNSLQFDFRWTDYNYCTDYSYYEEMSAYQRYRQFNNKSCRICLIDYQDEGINTDKQLLYCGHLYHKQCLINYERHKWENDNWPYPLCQCPLCKDTYHTHFEKYDFDKNYQQNLPFYYKSLKYPLWENIHSLFFGHWGRKYKQYRHKEWDEYPNKWNIDDYGY